MRSSATSRGFRAPPPRLRFAQAVLPQEEVGTGFEGLWGSPSSPSLRSGGPPPGGHRGSPSLGGKVAPAEPVTKGGSGSLQQSPLCSEDSARAWLLSHGVKRSGGGWEGVVSNNGILSRAFVRPEG